MRLPEMPLSEHVVNDYQTLSLSLKAHPMSFLREDFRAKCVISCGEVRDLPNGAHVAVAGVVLVRQMPGSAKGVVFMTIEDETGIANAVVWPKMLERFRKVVMTSRLIQIEGRIQKQDGACQIIHIVAARLADKSDWLLRLSEWVGDMRAPLVAANGGGLAEGKPGAPEAGNGECIATPFSQPKPRHPRNVRIIPKSRDFH